ncbi:hypothetical protein [Flavobacterium sp.]|uniref:hypothetical protein n=1 Tax=Flavobacterium sp. TaxID=239 RepID=UPI0011FDFA90|nr:hypothetical protein [Flavobacterium sp.]RZJ73547.1 MAG: hypothetical protein EOO49_01660 [Flavobacterium sp.]
MKVIVANYLIPKGFVGITLWPFVILASHALKHDETVVRHEKIHLKQQLELLVLPFFVWYGLEFVFRLMQFRNRKLAYRNICFEREAYANEKSPDYLQSRAFWSFLKYL